MQNFETFPQYQLKQFEILQFDNSMGHVDYEGLASNARSRKTKYIKQGQFVNFFKKKKKKKNTHASKCH